MIQSRLAERAHARAARSPSARTNSHLLSTHQLLLRGYIRWHLAHKLEGACTAGRFLASKQAVTVAVDFLNWLACESIPFPEVEQTDVDRYISEGTETRRLLTRFLPWATKTYRLPTLEITPHRRDTTREKTADEQIEQLRILFAHPDMTPQDRLMAALILVFGQQTHKVVALRWDNITTVDGALAITLGKHPVVLEVPLDDLVAAVRNSVVNRQTASNAKSDRGLPKLMKAPRQQSRSRPTLRRGLRIAIATGDGCNDRW